MFWKDCLPKRMPRNMFLVLSGMMIFPKIWSYSWAGVWKMIFLKKSTWKYNIFCQCSEKKVFRKKIWSCYNMILLVFSGNMMFLFSKIWSYSLVRKRKIIFFKKDTWTYDIFCIFCKDVIPFSYKDALREDTEYLSVFSPNAGKHGPEKTPFWTLFMQTIYYPFVKNQGWSSPEKYT